MKQVTKMSRLTGMIEKAFTLLNTDWFGGTLETPIISIVPCSRSYAHYTTFDAWNTTNGGKREINISSAYLNRSLDEIIASLQHEMVHMYNDTVRNVQDCSRGGSYHSKVFAIEAAKHGLNVEKSDKYGYSITSCGESLFDWICEHDELREIELYRVNPYGTTSIGGKAASGTTATTGGNTHNRKYQCPKCGDSVRATKRVNIGCLNCSEIMIEV